MWVNPIGKVGRLGGKGEENVKGLIFLTYSCRVKKRKRNRSSICHEAENERSGKKLLEL